MVHAETIYDAAGSEGPGFYNVFKTTNGNTETVVTYGPYPSRPYARIIASRMLVTIDDENKVLA